MTAKLQEAILIGANLREANLIGANLIRAYLCGANLQEALLESANLQEANLEGTQLKGAALGGMIFGNEKQVGPLLIDCQWGDVNIAFLDWSQVNMLGDEYIARQRKNSEGETKWKQTRLFEYSRAVRANRQLVVILHDQGLNEKADHFAYRAQILQRNVLWLQIGLWQWIGRLQDWIQQSEVGKLFTEFCQKMQQAEVWKQLRKLWKWTYVVGSYILKLGAFIFLMFLALLTGYGYKPKRILFWYILMVSLFAWAYYQVWAANHLERITRHTLSYVGAVIFSITAFHGRGFFLGGSDLGYDSLITILGAVEAVIGLVIELSFVATFTGRFFRR